ncbi:MAG: hypothetical protein KatS3mg105_4139 [Gemmatales bacterium]|nr:MAG: hypothetical protein KatS3mg105_4139 [Gemmatales bacterium]
MPYSAEISRTNPTCFLFLVDQSGSMVKPFGGEHGKIKAQGVADAINRLLQNLCLKCAKSDGVRNYFHVGVIGYGGNNCRPALGGELAGRALVPIGDIANKPLRVENRLKKVDDGAGGLIDKKFKFPIWFEPTGAGKTPMCQAFTMAHQVLDDFINKFPNCYPPLVINITDGVATDGNPEMPAARVKQLQSSDGAVLVFNVHLSSRQDRPVEFPDNERILPSDYAQMLFRMSSVLPPKIRAAAKAEGYHVSENTRGFVFNADLVSVIRFLDIGTKVGGR